MSIYIAFNKAVSLLELLLAGGREGTSIVI